MAEEEKGSGASDGEAPEESAASEGGAPGAKGEAAEEARAGDGEAEDAPASKRSDATRADGEGEDEDAPASKRSGATKAADDGDDDANAEPSPSSPWPSSRKGEKPAAAAKEEPTEPEKAAWGAPLDRLDRGWTRLEARLCAWVLAAEVLTLVFWISMKSLSSTGKGGPGLVFRCLVSALVLGLVTHRLTRKTPRHEVATTVAVLGGLFVGRYWGDAGTEYFANAFAWMQNASILVFFGGVSELAKRFTLWLALLGASVATAQGKHINVDVVMRFLTPRARVPVAVLGWLTAAFVSLTAAWGFFDNLAVEDFRAPTSLPCPDAPEKSCTAPWRSKVDKVLEDTGRNMFLAGRQLSLDLRSLPKVLAGEPYASWLTPREWNEWLRGGGWEKHFKAEDVKALELPEDGTVEFRNPAVTAIPGGTEPIPKLLVGLLNMVFPFGLLVIGIRFILRSLLAIGGWVKVDPNAAHGDEELAHAHDHSAEADAAQTAIEETVR